MCVRWLQAVGPTGDERGLLATPFSSLRSLGLQTEPLRSVALGLNDVNCWYSKRVNKIRYDSEIARRRRRYRHRIVGPRPKAPSE